MPNWVYNTLTIESEDDELLNIIGEKLRQPYQTNFPNLEYNGKEWVQVPRVQDNKDEFSFWNIISPDDMEAYYNNDKEKPALDLTLTGLADEISEGFRTGMGWYNWNVRNWGCKWDVSGVVIEHGQNNLMYRFDTPWSPPTPAMQKLSTQYPTATITLRFEEEQGWGGEIQWRDGEETVLHEWDVPKCHQDFEDRDGECWACNYLHKDNDGNWVGEDSLFSDCPRDYKEEK